MSTFFFSKKIMGKKYPTAEAQGGFMAISTKFCGARGVLGRSQTPCFYIFQMHNGRA
jgi:hypothetical protein